MTELQRSILALSTALALLLGALILVSTGRPAERPPVAGGKLSFHAVSAYENAASLASRFPRRGMGAEGGRAAAEWVRARMEQYGLRTETQSFSAWIAGERIKGQNVIGIHEGVLSGAIVIVAHYDIPFHAREGAMDDASGVGALLELARVLSREEQEKTLVFLASDGEEWGMLGARRFLSHWPGREQVIAAVSLDYVGLEEPEKVYLHGEGQFRGYAPMWLWMLAEECVRRAGGEPESPSPLGNYLSHAVNISGTDQGPFLRAGVPAINLGSDLSERPLERRIYHTPQDTTERLSPQLFEVYGRAAELLVRSLDAMDYPSDNSWYYLRTGERTYISSAGLIIFQSILFIPLLLATCFQYYDLRTRENFLRDAFTELANVVLFVVPWMTALAALYILVRTNVVPRYELYPATPLDPFLRDPQWTAVAIVAGVFAASWVVVSLVRRYFNLWARPDFLASKALCLDALFTLSIVAMVLNGFAATLFLAPAALLWVWIGPGRQGWRRALNAALALGGAAPFIALTVVFSKRLMLGPYVLWYLLLGAGYGFFSFFSVLIAVGAATVGGRLAQKSLMQPWPVRQTGGNTE